MSDIYSSISETGIIVADTQNIKSEIENEWRAIFGNQLSLEESTVQGRIIELLTASRKDCVSSMALVANQINPNVATGTFLDSIGQLFYIERVGAVATFVGNVTMEGTPDTTVPTGAIATDTSGNQYALSAQVTFGSDGKAFGNFVNIQSGAIPCPAHTLTTVDPQYSNWQSVYNGSNGTVGAEEESDYTLRFRIENSKAKYSQGYLSSIYSALYDINGVKDVLVLENPTSNPISSDNELNIPVPAGETISPHSIFAVVYGGSSDGSFYQQVAKAIMLKKSLGCGMQGSTVYPDNVQTVNVLDTGDDGTVFSTYPIVFNTPEPVPIYINVSVNNTGYSGEDLPADVKNVLSNWFSGNITDAGIEQVGIGYSISPFTMSTVLTSQMSGISVTNLQIGLSAQSLSANTIDIENNQIATVDINNITVSTN